VVPSLTYERKTSEPHAVYRLQKGEALYSSVAIRFTGRVYAKDVGDVLERIVKFNGIEDVARMPVGYPVKIPMDLLLPEYLPLDDPTRIAAEKSKQNSARYARRTRVRNLEGVHVILDAGHGGRDSGTAHGDVYESIYMYDVTTRLKRILEKKSGARVSMTTKSKSLGYDLAQRDVIDTESDHYVLTTPRYELEDAIVGVNLRWYLANSIFRRAIKQGLQKEKVVFLSIHADSLHPSLRGAMAYIPGERFVVGKYEKTDPIYLARAEVRERPTVRHTQNDALTAEGLSRELAESIISSFERSKLKVHPFNPVRDNVVREGREWVPAIIRHNVVPTRTLLEVCNLGNRRDRELIKTRRYRQQLAQAIYDGIVGFYEERNDSRVVAAR
jgi:N-acetylmuramoyl-L-alanine amidase